MSGIRGDPAGAGYPEVPLEPGRATEDPSSPCQAHGLTRVIDHGGNALQALVTPRLMLAVSPGFDTRWVSRDPTWAEKQFCVEPDPTLTLLHM